MRAVDKSAGQVVYSKTGITFHAIKDGTYVPISLLRGSFFLISEEVKRNVSK